MTQEEIDKLRALIEKATPLPWVMEWNWEMIDTHHIEGCALTPIVKGGSLLEIAPQITNDRLFSETAVNAIPALLDEVERLNERIKELEGKLSALENDLPLQKAVERIAELEKQLQKSQIRERQLYAVLEGAKRIASEYYAFGLEGFEGEYTQIVNQLKDEPPEVEK